MEATANLQLPYIMPSQAQKHVTHNEALSTLDALVQLCVHDRDLNAPPGAPSQGDRYIVAPDATGAWNGWDGAIASWADGGWHRIDPLAGWLAWVDDEEKFVRWTGLSWSDLGATMTALQGLVLLGIGTAADADNPFAAKLNKALWTARYDAEGGDGNLRYTLNKETAADTLSLLMQTGWSGRAEIGLAGSDDLVVKVSPDGTTWKEAIRFDRSSGVAQFPSNPALSALSGLTGSSGAFVRFTGAGTASMQPILGSVMESAGVPTGALMERGANANGSYERYASGLAICQMRVIYNTTVNGSQTYTLPGSMISSVGLATGGPTNNSNSELTAWKAADPTVHLVGPSSINIRSQTGGGTVTNVGVSIIAIGRWI